MLSNQLADMGKRHGNNVKHDSFTYKWLSTAIKHIKKGKFRGLSPRANYTDRATAA
jgi:hypothetical protein